MIRARPGEWRAALQAALLAATGTLATPATAAPPAASGEFAPPRGAPLILARKVVRELPGGAAIVATRRYRIYFRPIADGWQVDGVLIASEIEAPAMLSALAALERDRPDDSMFPLTLDHAGRIITEPTAGLGRGTVARAMRTASRIAAGATGDGFVAQVASAAQNAQGGVTRWPEALFLPRGLSGTSEQTFVLPDGSAGTIQVSLQSEPAAQMATMGHAARIVVTQAAGTRRVAREEWTLGPPGLPGLPSRP